PAARDRRRLRGSPRAQPDHARGIAASPPPRTARPAGRGGDAAVMFGERERPLMPAQFALRVAILSGFALVMFSIIFFRLWYLQVLSGDKYLKQAKNN